MTDRKEQTEPCRVIAGLRQQLQDQKRTIAQLRLNRTSAFIDTITRSIPMMIAVKNVRTGRFVYWNRMAEEVTGFSASQVIGQTAYDLLPEAEAEIFVKGDREAVASRRPLEMSNLEFCSRQGKRILQVIKTPVLLETSRPLIVSIAQDVTRQYELEQDAEKQRNLTQAILNAVDLQIALLDQDGTIVALNQAWEQNAWFDEEDSQRIIFGRNFVEQCRHAATDESHGRTAQRIVAGLTGVLSQGRTGFSMEYECSGGQRPTYNLLNVNLLQLDHFRGAVVSRLDITRRRQAELAVQERHDRIASKVRQNTAELQLFEKIFHSALEGITVTDATGRIVNVNDAFTRITGYSREEALGQNPRILKSDRHGDEFYQQMWDRLVDNGIWEGEIWNRRKDGEVYPEWLSINAITVPEDGTINYVAVFHDITQLKEKEAEIEHLAYRDPLTGLPNRALMLDRLEMALKRAERGKTGVAVLFIDLDNFKNINDSLGHPVGDQLLCEVANHLSSLLRGSDTVARIGGDEFIVISHFQQSIEVLTLADRIQTSFQQPFQIGIHSFYVSLSIGIAVFPDDGGNADRLIQNADLALYQAKAHGKNCFRLYDGEMNTRLVARFTLEQELREAVDGGGIRVHYQPQVNLKTGRILGFEALARWYRKDGSMVPPDQFIPVAEETGLIEKLGLHVLDTACRDMQLLTDAGFGGLRLSVNLSAVQFRDRQLANRITEVIDRLGFDPACLELEVTETIMMTNLEAIEKILNDLARTGIRISVDDFGTGYSSLAYLKRFPIAALKIDRSFIRDISEDPNDRAIVEAILTMAGALNIETVAEGVEKEEQQLFLSERRCGIGQGYFYSRPLPLHQLLDFLQCSPYASAFAAHDSLCSL